MSTCKQCGSQVQWRHIGGKLCCLNEDGSDHWDLCSKLRFERARREGTKFADVDLDNGQIGTGYLHNGKMKLESMHTGYSITGKDYKPDGCRCGRPPWELCQPACEHAI